MSWFSQFQNLGFELSVATQIDLAIIICRIINLQIQIAIQTQNNINPLGWVRDKHSQISIITVRLTTNCTRHATSIKIQIGYLNTHRNLGFFHHAGKFFSKSLNFALFLLLITQLRNTLKWSPNFFFHQATIWDILASNGLRGHTKCWVDSLSLRHATH